MVNVKEIRKFLVAAGGALGLLASFVVEHATDLLPPNVILAAQGIIVLLMAAGVYGVPQLPGAEVRAAVEQSGGTVVLPGGLKPAAVVPDPGFNPRAS